MTHLQLLLNIHGEQMQFLLFLTLFVLGWNIENIAGVFSNQKKWLHSFINAPFMFTNMPGQILLGFAFVKTIQWDNLNSFGFLYHLPGQKNTFLYFLLAFTFLDLGEYVYHVIMHRFKNLWKFHMIHHSDTILDVSTTLREHPAESFIRLIFTLFWVLLSGTAFWALMLRQIIQVVTTLFAHINYRLPDKIDKFVGIIFITPNLHQVHHHYKRPYTDCNYGDVLSIWDRLFGTFKRLDAKELVFGVDTYLPSESKGKFISLLLEPFRRNNKIPWKA